MELYERGTDVSLREQRGPAEGVDRGEEKRAVASHSDKTPRAVAAPNGKARVEFVERRDNNLYTYFLALHRYAVDVDAFWGDPAEVLSKERVSEATHHRIESVKRLCVDILERIRAITVSKDRRISTPVGMIRSPGNFLFPYQTHERATRKQSERMIQIAFLSNDLLLEPRVLFDLCKRGWSDGVRYVHVQEPFASPSKEPSEGLWLIVTVALPVSQSEQGICFVPDIQPVVQAFRSKQKSPETKARVQACVTNAAKKMEQFKKSDGEGLGKNTTFLVAYKKLSPDCSPAEDGYTSPPLPPRGNICRTDVVPTDDKTGRIIHIQCTPMFSLLSYMHLSLVFQERLFTLYYDFMGRAIVGCLQNTFRRDTIYSQKEALGSRKRARTSDQSNSSYFLEEPRPDPMAPASCTTEGDASGAAAHQSEETPSSSPPCSDQLLPGTEDAVQEESAPAKRRRSVAALLDPVWGRVACVFTNRSDKKK